MLDVVPGAHTRTPGTANQFAGSVGLSKRRCRPVVTNHSTRNGTGISERYVRDDHFPPSQSLD